MKHWTEEQNRNVEEYLRASANRADKWVAGCGGTEVPAKNRNGKKVLYVFNHATVTHGYLDMGSDIVYKDLELTESI